MKRNASIVAKVLAPIAAVLTVFGGMAYAGALPRSVQNAVSHAAGTVGVTLPSDEDTQELPGENDDSQGDNDNQGEDSQGDSTDQTSGDDQGDTTQSGGDQGDQGGDTQGDGSDQSSGDQQGGDNQD